MLAMAAGPAPVVRLNVPVVDRQGNPVEDMTATDFRIRDLHRARQVLFVRRSPSQPVVILLDCLNASLPDRNTLADEMASALDARTLSSRGGVFVYLLNLDGKVLPITPVGGAAKWDPNAAALIRTAVGKAGPFELANITAGRRLSLTFDAMRRAAAEAALMPGHRNLVWISRGLVMEAQASRTQLGSVDFHEAMDDLVRELGTLDVSVATIGLSTMGGNSTRSARDMQEELAASSGGQHFDRSFGIAAAIRESIHLANSSYTVGFRPDYATAGKEHRVVKLTTPRKDVVLRGAPRISGVPHQRRPRPHRERDGQPGGRGRHPDSGGRP